MTLCIGLHIDTTEAGVFDGVSGATKVFGDEIRWVVGINGLASAGAIALGVIGGDILNGDCLGGDYSEDEERC